MISKLYAAYSPSMGRAIFLDEFASELELNKALVKHLEERNSDLRIPLTQLRVALEGFEEAFYRKEVLSEYCCDPKHRVSQCDIFSAAYRKDLSNPFYEGYILKLLALEDLDAGLRSVSSLNELKKLGILRKVVAMVKAGLLHFKSSDFELRYVASVKQDVNIIIINRIKEAFIKKFAEQQGYPTNLLSISRCFIISPSSIGRIGSNMTLQQAKYIFIHLPYIKFTSK